MSIPTVQEFQQIATRTVGAISQWAKETFDISFMPVALKFTDRKLRFYGQASMVRDKMERLTGFGIKLSSHDFTRYPQRAVTEYASYSDVRGIGAFESTDTRLGIETLVAHEMAHVIQFALYLDAMKLKGQGQEHSKVSHWLGATPIFGMGLGHYESGHGSFFQKIYRMVRDQFINDRVPLSAYTNPKFGFVIPDTFDEQLAAMPKSGLEGIRFMNNGRWLTVAGRNPKRNRLFDYQVRDEQGKHFRCKMSLIVSRSPEAKFIVETRANLRAEYAEHCRAQQAKSAANMKSRATKSRRRV